MSQFIITIMIVTIGICIARNSYFIWSPNLLGNVRSDAFLPNQQIANKITTIWQQHSNEPLKYIAGDHYLTAYITAYAPDNPTPYMDFNNTQSPWINEQDLKKHGGILVWETDSPLDDNIPNNIQQRFPNAKFIGVFAFNKLVEISTTPVYIKVAILPAQTLFPN